MESSLLQTKLNRPPPATGLVRRRRLTDQISAGLLASKSSTAPLAFRRSLTLVSAPAGAGKTTLVNAWLNTPTVAARRPHIAWLSLDAYDNDPALFWQYVLATLRTAVAGIGAAAEQLLILTPLPTPPVLLTGLLNEVNALARPLLLVVDDYHHITSGAIHAGMDYLLDHAPSNFHLVLLTRADPPLALPRMRARGRMTEMRLADLLFTEVEAARFLRNVMDLRLSNEDVTILNRRTEGWITGLQLAAVSLNGRDDPGQFIRHFGASHLYILDYLATEVLEQLPPEMRTFLLQTAILARLSASLCDAVTGRAGAHLRAGAAPNHFGFQRNVKYQQLWTYRPPRS